MSRKEANNLLKAIGFFANADNISAAISPALKNCKDSSEVLAGGEIAASSIALLFSGLLYCCNSERSRLPHIWLSVVMISCIISIIGSGLILSQDKCATTEDITGVVLIGVSKLLHPLVTQAFLGPDLIPEEQDTEHQSLRN